jgi:chaperonin cofactor prefoldin
MASQERNNTFNLYQEVLVFTDKASRNGRIAVPREEYVRNLRRGFRGITFHQLTDALMQLEVRGLVKIEWLGPDNFNVTLTQTTINLLHKAPAAAVPGQRPQPAAGAPRAQGAAVTPVPSKTAPKPVPPKPQQKPAGDAPGPISGTVAQKLPPPKPQPEEITISTFGDISETNRETQTSEPERLATRRNEMNDWLSSQLTALGEREEEMNRRDAELKNREETLSRWERDSVDRVEDIEKRFQTALTNVMDELRRQERLLPELYRAVGVDRSSVAELLKPIRECEAKIDELERERGVIRRSIKEMQEALNQHGPSG